MDAYLKCIIYSQMFCLMKKLLRLFSLWEDWQPQLCEIKYSVAALSE